MKLNNLFLPVRHTVALLHQDALAVVAAPCAARMAASSRLSSSKSGSRWGFSLIEAILAIATLALLGGAVTTLYISGTRALQGGSQELLLQSSLRSEMEVEMSKDFFQLKNKTNLVSIARQGVTNVYEAVCSVAPADLDGDGTPETNAKLVTLALEGQTLTVLIADHEGKVGKL